MYTDPDTRPDLACLDPAALTWQRSTFAHGARSPVEVAFIGGYGAGVVLRVGSDPAGPMIAVSRTAFDEWIDGVVDGEFRQRH